MKSMQGLILTFFAHQPLWLVFKKLLVTQQAFSLATILTSVPWEKAAI